MSREFQHLFFDLDGTLVDSKAGIVDSLLRALKDHGIFSVEPSRIEIGPPIEQTVEKVIGAARRSLIPTLVRSYREHYGETGVRQSVLYPGMAQTLEVLGRERTLFVVTSKAGLFARLLVDNLGIGQAFRKVYGSELNGERSDKGDLIQYVLGEEGIRPETVAMIGDREHDIRGARRNGLFSVGVTWGYGSPEELKKAGADRVIDSPGELWAIAPGTAFVS